MSTNSLSLLVIAAVLSLAPERQALQSFSMLEEWQSGHDTFIPGLGETPLSDEIAEADLPVCRQILRSLNSTVTPSGHLDTNGVTILPAGLQNSPWQSLAGLPKEHSSDKSLNGCLKQDKTFFCTYYAAYYKERGGAIDRLLMEIYHFHDGRSPEVAVYNLNNGEEANLIATNESIFMSGGSSFLGNWGEESLSFIGDNNPKIRKHPLKTFVVSELTRLSNEKTPFQNTVCVFSLKPSAEAERTHVKDRMQVHK